MLRQVLGNSYVFYFIFKVVFKSLKLVKNFENNWMNISEKYCKTEVGIKH